MTVVARIFPRRTKATPTDALAFTEPPGLFPPNVDAIHVSVTFTWDLARAEWLAKQWAPIAPVTISGPATGARGGDFELGQYVAPGYVITSRGCPNRCWFCDVWRREGPVRELPIREGHNVLDDNLLACSEGHTRDVFAMLKRQRGPIEFTGGLEAARLQDWHVDLLWDLKPKQMFFAYDSDDDYEPLIEAGRKLLAAGWTTASHRLRAFVLIGYPKDTFKAAEKRLRQTMSTGFLPMAMLWRGAIVKPQRDWRQFQRIWTRPAMTVKQCGA